MRSPYTDKQLAFLRAGYKKMPIAELTVAFNRRFRKKKTAIAIKSTIFREKMKRGRRKKKGFPIQLFNKEQIKFIKRAYKKMSVAELTVEVNKKFRLNITKEQMKTFVHNHGINSGRTGCFEKGSESWNKGTKGLTGANSCSFKKGDIPANRKPLGDERVCLKDGYILIKVAEKNPYTGAPTRYKAKHVVVWEETNGPVPKGMKVFFLDCNKLNCAIENLTLITKAQGLYLNQHGYQDLPPELRPSMLALSQVETKRFSLLKERQT